MSGFKGSRRSSGLFDNRFDSLDLKLASVDGELAVIKAELAMVTWIVSGVGFGVVLLVIRSFWAG